MVLTTEDLSQALREVRTQPLCMHHSLDAFWTKYESLFYHFAVLYAVRTVILLFSISMSVCETHKQKFVSVSLLIHLTVVVQYGVNLQRQEYFADSIAAGTTKEKTGD